MKRDRSCQTAKGRACCRRDLGLEVCKKNLVKSYVFDSVKRYLTTFVALV